MSNKIPDEIVLHTQNAIEPSEAGLAVHMDIENATQQQGINENSEALRVRSANASKRKVITISSSRLRPWKTNVLPVIKSHPASHLIGSGTLPCAIAKPHSLILSKNKISKNTELVIPDGVTKLDDVSTATKCEADSPYKRLVNPRLNDKIINPKCTTKVTEQLVTAKCAVNILDNKLVTSKYLINKSIGVKCPVNKLNDKLVDPKAFKINNADKSVSLQIGIGKVDDDELINLLRNPKQKKLIVNKQSGGKEIFSTCNIIRAIGQENFNILISALETVTNSELKRKALLGLLTQERTFKDVSTATEIVYNPNNNTKINGNKRRSEPFLSPKDDTFITITKTVTDPHLLSEMRIKSENREIDEINDKNKETTKVCNDDKTNVFSIGSQTIASYLQKPETELFTLMDKMIDKNDISSNHSEPGTVDIPAKKLNHKRPNSDTIDFGNKRHCFINENKKNLNSYQPVKVKEVIHTDETMQPINTLDLNALFKNLKPTVWFNLLTKENLEMLSNDEDRRLLQKLQMYIDYKYCLVPGDDQNLPIHKAVLDEDFDLLTRQCLMLTVVKESVDIGDAQFNYSALQMCVLHGAPIDFVRALLKAGASAISADDEERTVLHNAAEAASHEYLQILLEHMAANARFYLTELGRWRPEMEALSARSLCDALFTHVCSLFDVRGHSPLMLAAREGNTEHVMLLLERIADAALAADVPAPASGNTALFIAVEAACLLAKHADDMTKVPEKYISTIEGLIRYGADPWIVNKSNATIQSYLKEFHFTAMLDLIHNSLLKPRLRNVSVKVECSNVDADEPENVLEVPVKNHQPFIIVKTRTGVEYIQTEGKAVKKNYIEEAKSAEEDDKVDHDGNIKEGKNLKPRILVKSKTGKIDVLDPDLRMRRTDLEKYADSNKKADNEVKKPVRKIKIPLNKVHVINTTSGPNNTTINTGKCELAHLTDEKNKNVLDKINVKPVIVVKSLSKSEAAKVANKGWKISVVPKGVNPLLRNQM